MIEQTILGGTFTFPATSTTVNRMGYGAMQLAGEMETSWYGDLRETSREPSPFSERSSLTV